MFNGSLKQIYKDSTPKALWTLFQADTRPWVVAFSGGKDSTVLLHLVYEMVMDHFAEIFKPVYILTTDTRVEAPPVTTYLEDILKTIQNHIDIHKLPIHILKVQPTAEESFWGKLIGKGYPPPTRWFRWCTASMKIRPAKNALEKIIREFGSVILLLGTRLAESSARKKRMENRETSHRGLNPHTEIKNALVATPIMEWSNNEVWQFLGESAPPWSGDYDNLKQIYGRATGGECHFALDMLAPSCGGSRFGCWTCTVVKDDISMRGFITSGETWMRPLYEYRNWLKTIREDPSMRMPVRRDGRPGLGPFTYDARKKILKSLIDLETELGLLLINNAEIQYIQNVWTQEFDSRQSAYAMARNAGKEVTFMPGFSLETKEQNILDQLIQEEEIHPRLIEKLLNLVRDQYPSLEVYGAKIGLEKELAKAIENAVTMRWDKEAANDI